MIANYSKKEISRKLLSILVIAAMVITSLSIPAASSKAYAETKTTRTTQLDLIDISSTDTQGAEYSSATDTYTCEAEGWTWNATSKVLTLDGATIDTSATTEDTWWNVALLLPEDSTIKLESDSTVIAGNSTPENGGSNAIDSEANLTIEGAGRTLNVKSGDGAYSYGIFTDKEKLTVAADTTIVASSGKANSGYSTAISSNGLVNNGTIKATTADSEDAASYGVYSYKGDIVNNGTIRATGGDAERYSSGIRCFEGDIVNNGYMYGRAGAATEYDSCGIWALDGDITSKDFIEGVSGEAGKHSYGIYLNGNLTNDDTMWAMADDAVNTSSGIYVCSEADENNGNLVNGKDGEILSYGKASEQRFSMGIFTVGSFENNGDARGFADDAGMDATASDVVDADVMDSIGINAQGGIVNNGHMIGCGENSRDYTDGIYSDKDLVNNEDATMVARAGKSKGSSCAIEAYETLTNSGDMEAEGADEGTAYGISAQNVTFKGCDSTVEACGATAAVHAAETLLVSEEDGLRITGGTEKQTASGTDILNETGKYAEEYARITRAKKFIASATAYKTSVKFSWDEVTDAWTYKVYMAKCGTSKWKYVKDSEYDTTATIKGLKAGTKYKAYVVAYDENGYEITNSPYVYVITTGGKLANATKVTASETLSTAHGRKTTITAKIASKSSSKTLFWKSAGSKIRYYSADTSIATVNKTTGKVSALKKGTVNIYSLAPSGAYAVTKLTVE